MPLAAPSIDPALRQEIHARVGQTLSQRYTLEEVIDVGGTCAVYRGVHRNGNRVAVKVLHRSRAATKEAFLKGAYTANKVEHPAALRVLDDDTTEDGTAFIVMDYLEGHSLTSLLQRSGGGMSEKQLVPLMAQLCDVLAAAHAKGITHGALSPRKLFVDKDRSLHVLGFGTAATDPEHMAPEQARGEPADALTDLWTVGAVMFTALSGQAVYAADTAEQIKELAAAKPAPELLSVVSGIDIHLAAIVDRATAASPNERWKNAGAMATALRTPLGAAFGTKTTAMMVQSVPPPGEPVVLKPLVEPTVQSPVMTASAPPPPIAPTMIGNAPTQFQAPQPFPPPAAPFGSEAPPPMPPPPYAPYPQGYPGQSGNDGGWVKWVAAAAALIVLFVIGLGAAGFLFFRAAKNKAAHVAQSAATAAKWDDADSPVPVSANDPMWGNRDALVTIVQFSDFQCPFCGRVEPTITQVKNEYGPAKVRIIWKNQPLPFHPNAKPAAEAAQVVFTLKGSDAFFTWHDLAFNNQARLGPDNYRVWALESGVNGPAYDKAMLSTATADKKIEDDQAIAKMVGALGTPGFRINGIELSGAQPLDKFKTVIDAELTKAAAKIASGTPKNRIYVVLSSENYTAKKAEPDKPVEDTTTTWRVPVGTSPMRGPADAPVTIVEFGDFQCPFCKKAEATVQQVHDTYGDKVRIVWKDTPLAFHPRAEPSAELAREARAEKGDAAFWKMHDALFDAQPRLEDDDLFKLGSKAGLDAAKVKSAINTHKRKSDIDLDAELADDVSSSGTPSFFINGRHLVGAQPFEKFQAMIDEELKKFADQKVSGKDYYASIQRDAKSAPEPEKKHAPPVPSTAPFRGGKNAKVVIQEWADFQCPFCLRAESTVTEIAKDYGDKVKIVWHDKPLPMHPDAALAAEAAREAFEQKGNAAFWTMHDSLFVNHEHLKRDDLDSYATKQGLDMKRWAKGLDGDTHKSDIDADDKLGTEIGITGTPSFLVNDYYLSGAQPYPKFKKLIDRALAESK